MTNRYSRTGTALADGISGTRVMQPANNAVIQAPALSVSPVQIALRIKKPLWKSGAHSCRNLSCVRRRFNRKKQTGRPQTRPFISESKLRRKKAFRPPWTRAGLRFYGTGRLGSLQSGIIHLNSQPEHADSHQAENAGSGDGKNVHCQLPPLRLFPASTNQRPQRAADGTGANAPLFFPGGLSSGIQVGPHHHGMRKWLRLHYGKV